MQRLEAAEVDRGLRLARLSWNVSDVELEGNGKTSRMGTECRTQSIRRQQRRVDAASELAQVVDGFVGVRLQLCQHWADSAARLADRFGDADLQLERDQVLLGTVMQVALDPATLLVLGRHEALPGSAKIIEPRQQLSVQANILEDQAGLPGQVAHELLLHRIHRLAAFFHDREGAEQLALVADASHAVTLELRQRAIRHRQLMADHTVGGRRGGGEQQPRPGAHPDLGALGAGSLGQKARHAVEEILLRKRFREMLAKLRERLVWRRPFAVDEPIGQALGPLPQRLEGEGNDGGGDEGQQELLAPANHCADAHHDHDVDGGDQDGQPAVDERLVDDDVDVIEAIAQHRDPDRNRQRRGGEWQQQRNLQRWNEDLRYQRDQQQRDRGKQPFQLLAFLLSAAPEAHHE